MNCQRAVAILLALWRKSVAGLGVLGNEMDELVALGLVVEADVLSLATLQNIDVLSNDYREYFMADGDLLSPDGIRAAIDDVGAKLKNEWYRIRTSNAELARQEKNLVALRAALGVMSDPTSAALVRKAHANRSHVAAEAAYIACPAVGAALFALTWRGVAVGNDLNVRLERFAAAPLKTFMMKFQKAETKMLAFSQEIQSLSSHVGYVRKGKAQIVTGLVKSGLPPAQALPTYFGALTRTVSPHAAVLLTQHATRHGGPGQVQYKLGIAHNALLRAGFPSTPLLAGLAKSLLAFDPPDAGIPRFLELHQRLQAAHAHGDALLKFTARLMPAVGTPADVVRRAAQASHLLSTVPDPPRRGYVLGPASVALAAMARDDASVHALCARFVAIERALRGAQVLVEGDDVALECVGCPGTPAEVVALVKQLRNGLTAQGVLANESLAVAAAFAKRFAY